VDLDTFHHLLSPAGQEALQAAADLKPREQDFLAHFTTLSRHFPTELARTALEIAILREEAARKFPFADRLYFTREALEQASNWEISNYRARRYQGFPRLLDLGCSIGSDTLALAQVAPTTGIDLDPLRLAMAHANLAAMDLQKRASFVQANLTSSLPLSPPPFSPALFFDPARRAGHRRTFSVRHYQPPLKVIETWLPEFPALGVKVSPGVDRKELRDFDAEVEFISLRGELKEAVLWFGPLKTTSCRATLLPGPHTLTSGLDTHLPIVEPEAYLYEPDPAILRAGLVAALGEQLGASQLDADIAYLTSQDLQPTPFARSWRIEAWFPFQLKRLRAYLRQRQIGRVTVKKRGSPIEPESLIGDLRLSGEAERTIFLTHMRGEPIVVVAFS
jgi:SAM-dependent methyltransferase